MNLLALINEVFNNDKFISATLSNPKDKSYYRKLEIKLINIKLTNVYQFIYYSDTQVFHKNFSKKEAINTFNNEIYELSLDSKELVILYQYESNEYIEHYSKNNCSLLDIEFMEVDKLYHHFILENIIGNNEVKKDEETGEYYVYSSESEEGEASTNIDFETMTLNYTIIDSYTVSIDNQETPILMLKIRDDYLSENGLPFGFK